MSVTPESNETLAEIEDADAVDAVGDAMVKADGKASVDVVVVAVVPLELELPQAASAIVAVAKHSTRADFTKDNCIHNLLGIFF